MTALTLYALAGEYKEAADKLAEMDLDEQTISDTLESLSGDLEAKATNTIMLVRNLEATAEQIKTAEKAMAERRKVFEARAARIRQYVMDTMIFAGIQKIECPLFKIAIRDNPPSVVIDDEKQIPQAYLTDPLPPPRAPDKKLIAQAIKDGHEVPGAHLERGQRLEVK
ncbi:siphovirus Gp157 family protein [Burkholderia multivorans]|uniref:siphovirus Gp157 family protein n=1 Tax=Burkholderia multivorans TaxID=87883 RepID=UPI000D010B71|nr:siphovirus Gp157 family protein [Burkholderia multivorans]MBU9534602.1 siphovirus Gp157 family protein [Burkholderia multivorans]MDR8787936.1 hypothetical protein [Burkholderia multivorans]MDR8828899.1 hypothetical protein [Burkholderia multivorans]PRF91641.1 hypothetical protein C6Q23_09925 [Burkholderia multivorans]